MTVGITIEARMESDRLPGKVMLDLHGKPLLERMIERLKRVRYAEKIIIALPVGEENEPIIELAKRLDVEWCCGSERDVLSRVLGSALMYKVDVIVETCGDCPVIDPKLLDVQIALFKSGGMDYLGVRTDGAFPIGIGAKVFSTKTLLEVDKLTDDPIDRENVSNYIYEHPDKYECLYIEPYGHRRHADLRLVVDYQEDLDLMRKIYAELYDKKPDFDYDDILDYHERCPEVFDINRGVKNIEMAGRDEKN